VWDWMIGYRSESPMASVILLKLATGQRTEECLRIANVRRDGFAFYSKEKRTVDWPVTKTGKPHVIPLPRQAILVLDGIEAGAEHSGGRFFPHQSDPDKTATIHAPWRCVQRYLESHPEMPLFTPRDLRRTWKTLSGAAGLSKDIRDVLQGHSASDVSARHYDRWARMPERIEAMAKWSDYLAGTIGVEVPAREAQVISGRRGRRFRSASGASAMAAE
jgi:integrase